MKSVYIQIISIFLLLIGAVSMQQGIGIANAQNIDELRDKIDNRQDRIAQIEQEIKKYEQQVLVTGQRTDSLENKVANLRASQRKLEAEIRSMETQIESKGYTIQKLEAEIKNIEQRVENHTKAIGATLRKINEADQQSIIETLLLHENISSFYGEIETLDAFQDQIRTRIQSLRELKKNRATKRDDTRQTKRQLENLQNQLSDKNRVLEVNKQETSDVLTKTQQKEARYQALLEQKRKQREQFLRELNDLESQLQIAIDKDKLPGKGSKVFSGPLANTTMATCNSGAGGNCVTQFFGNTEFAQGGAYNGNGHNGMDFRAGVGDNVYAPAGGTVRALGNTDVEYKYIESGKEYKGMCQSYGRWLLIEHDNGLSSLFAHLSGQAVAAGTRVDRGEVVGYSGNTGYSTGPHLHWTVLATEGVRVINLADWYRRNGRPTTTGCARAGVKLPIAPHEAYLDPRFYY